MKEYNVGFVGTSNFQKVLAVSEKEAKKKFADLHNIPVSLYITIKRKVK